MRKRDIRNIYTNALAVEDSFAREAAENARKEERYKRMEADAKLAVRDTKFALLQENYRKQSIQLADALRQIKQLEMKLSNQDENVKPTPTLSIGEAREDVQQVDTLRQENSTEDQESWTYALQATIPTRDSRVLALSDDVQMLCVGTTNGYGRIGLLKISTLDPRHQVMIPCHQQQVRDIALNSTQPMALTTAMDGSVKMISLQHDTCVQSFRLQDCQGWSCAWDQGDPNVVRKHKLHTRCFSRAKEVLLWGYGWKTVAIRYQANPKLCALCTKRFSRADP